MILGFLRMTEISRLIIGAWSVDPAACRIVAGGEQRVLEPKVMDLLVLLASEPNRVFSREELHGHLWPDVTVGDDSLARCVFKLRKALSDDAEAPRFVETITKRGYRLIAPVGGPGATAPEPRPAARLYRPWAVAAVAVAGLAAVATVGMVLMARPGPGFYPAEPGTSAAAEAARHKVLAEEDRRRQDERERR
jgi:DNA-binding winged helix-turn-helix (wHTH) protein